MTYFLVYVDNLLLTGNDELFLKQFQDALASQFSLKDLGTPIHFLGVEIVPTSHGLFLSQHHYIRYLLQTHNMHDDARPVNTHLSTTCNLTSGDVSSCDDTIYCQLVDSLQYLSHMPC